MTADDQAADSRLSSDAERPDPWPTLSAEYLLLVAGKGGGLVVSREFTDEAEALAFGRRLGSRGHHWRLMFRFVSPWQRYGSVRQMVETEVTDGPDPADRLPTGQKAPDAPQPGQKGAPGPDAEQEAEAAD